MAAVLVNGITLAGQKARLCVHGKLKIIGPPIFFVITIHPH